MEHLKTCSKCKKELPGTSFPKGKTCRDGLLSYCKTCKKAYDAAYAQAHAEEIKARWAAYLAANPEKAKALKASTKLRAAAYYVANKNKSKESVKAWCKANPEKMKALYKRRRQRNPEKFKAKDKARRQANPEYFREKAKAWAEANPDAILAAKKRQVANISDGYVRHLLRRYSTLRTADMPPTLIELTRAQLLLTRKIKELKK